MNSGRIQRELQNIVNLVFVARTMKTLYPGDIVKSIHRPQTMG